jgi:FAD/FMN-containing dehydrogenase
MLPAAREWARGLHAALGEHAMSRGTYVNAVDIQDPGEVRDTYGAKFDRLAAVKATYDPDNVFHRNVNISSSPIPAPRH